MLWPEGTCARGLAVRDELCYGEARQLRCKSQNGRVVMFVLFVYVADMTDTHSSNVSCTSPAARSNSHSSVVGYLLLVKDYD